MTFWHYLLVGMVMSAILSLLPWSIRLLVVFGWPVLVPVYFRRIPRIVRLLWQRYWQKRRIR